MRVTKRRLSEMRAFLKDFNVKMKVVSYGEHSCADIENRTVEIERDSVETMWELLFHELCHIVCADEGIYPKYHSMSSAKTKEHKLAIRRTGLRAEVYVDKMAEKLYNSYFPTLPKYETNYRTWVPITWHKAWMDELFK